MTQDLSQELRETSMGDLKNLTERLRIRNRHSRNDERRQEITSEALKLWHDNAETYRISIIKYKFLANERRRTKVVPLLTVPEKVLREYPVIKLFHYLDETSAREYLDSLDFMSLAVETHRISETIQFGYAYRTIVNKAIEFSYRQKNPKMTYCQSIVTDERYRKKFT